MIESYLINDCQFILDVPSDIYEVVWADRKIGEVDLDYVHQNMCNVSYFIDGEFPCLKNRTGWPIKSDSRGNIIDIEEHLDRVAEFLKPLHTQFLFTKVKL